MLDGVSHKVIGIMPPDFRYGWGEYEFWAPPAMDAGKAPRTRADLEVMARLKPGVSITTADAEMNTIARRLEMQYPETNANLKIGVRSLTRSVSEGPRPSIYIMVAVVGFVLLIAWANVANLLLARGTGTSGCRRRSIRSRGCARRSSGTWRRGWLGCREASPPRPPA